jgi:hypothetical protein
MGMVITSGPTQAHSSLDRTAETLGRQFIEALARQDFAALAACFGSEAPFRALVPRGLREASGGTDASRYFQGWFGPAERIDVLDTSVNGMADRYHLAWRLRVHDENGQRVVEQQAYVTERDGQFVAFDLLCSGFRVEPAVESHTPSPVGS